MGKIERSAIVPFSCQQMFDLINDIPSYPQFMRGCSSAEILTRGDGWLTARLELSRAGVRQSFITRNVLTPPHRIELGLLEGPFKSFSGEWRFEALGDQACKVSFWLSFQFSSRIVALAAGKLFEKVASDQVDMICQRARDIYTASSV